MKGVGKQERVQQQQCIMYIININSDFHHKQMNKHSSHEWMPFVAQHNSKRASLSYQFPTLVHRSLRDGRESCTVRGLPAMNQYIIVALVLIM